MTLLTLRDVACQIGQQPILHNVNLTIERGEILGLVGESGSGKSMTALAIMQLLPQQALLQGDIILDGIALNALPEAELCAIRGSRIGLIFQEPMTALNPLQTIGEQIAEMFTQHRGLSFAEALDHARALMNRVGLDEIPANRYPHELSGGQRQRVVIAMAIACRPDLLIADEPTSALDVTTQAQILALLKDLTQETGASLLLISHDLAVVASMADRIAVMKDGTIIETDQTARFFGGMKQPYSRALLAASTYRPKRVQPSLDQAPFFVVDKCTRIYRKKTIFPSAAQAMHAVDHVSFTIKAGESVGLVGESGSGKSTLARALLGLDPLDEGTISLNGQVLKLKDRADQLILRRKVQLVFQDPYSSFDPRRTIGWSIGEALGHLTVPVSVHEKAARIKVLLEQVGLSPDFATRYPHEMSGGQRQRAAIARALMTDPELIVLDEPVSALDVSVRATILDVLVNLQKERSVAYLFITHDLSLLRTMTDRTFVMQNGRIVEEGATDAVMSKPRHPYTRSLIDAAPDLETIITMIRETAAKRNS